MDENELAIALAEFIRRCVYGFPAKAKGFDWTIINPMLTAWHARIENMLDRANSIRTSEIIKAQQLAMSHDA